MKLICPKCQAQYEIPDVAIPETGRDVQCANCEETWFQTHPDSKADLDQTATAGDAKPSDPKPSDPKSSDAKPADPKSGGPKSGGMKSEAPSAPDQDTAEKPAVPVRELSPAVTDILRQEAAREKEARAAKTKEPEETSTAPLAATRPGRERLPEISDIDVSNPRLNPTAEVEDGTVSAFDIDTALPVASRKKGFKRGFAVVVLLMGLALLIYISAPQLAQKYPDLRVPLQNYLDAVNSARVWLDTLVSGLMG